MGLQVLHENIRDTSKILTNKRATKIDVDENSVKATMADGTVYEGDILIGADGVHSAVRQQMWNIGDKMLPGYIPASDKLGKSS